MGGKDGIRGYAIQTLHCLLKSLKDNNWDSFKLEPDEKNDFCQKIDIIWYKNGSCYRHSQIKSAKVINKNNLDKWVNELQSVNKNDEIIDLVVYGNPSSTVLKRSNKTEDNIRISIIESMNLKTILKITSSELHKFLEGYEETFGLSKINYTMLEILCRTLISELFIFSTVPDKKYSRKNFLRNIKKWGSILSLNYREIKKQFIPQIKTEYGAEILAKAYELTNETYEIGVYFDNKSDELDWTEKIFKKGYEKKNYFQNLSNHDKQQDVLEELKSIRNSTNKFNIIIYNNDVKEIEDFYYSISAILPRKIILFDQNGFDELNNIIDDGIREKIFIGSNFVKELESILLKTKTIVRTRSLNGRESKYSLLKTVKNVIAKKYVVKIPLFLCIPENLRDRIMTFEITTIANSHLKKHRLSIKI